MKSGEFLAQNCKNADTMRVSVIFPEPFFDAYEPRRESRYWQKVVLMLPFLVHPDFRIRVQSVWLGGIRYNACRDSRAYQRASSQGGC